MINKKDIEQAFLNMKLKLLAQETNQPLSIIKKKYKDYKKKEGKKDGL